MHVEDIIRPTIHFVPMVCRSFQSILGLLRADASLRSLAGKYQGTEKGGRSLLAKVCKLQEDLEVVSLTMDRHVAEGGAHTSSTFWLRQGIKHLFLSIPKEELFSGKECVQGLVDAIAFRSHCIPLGLKAVIYIRGCCRCRCHVDGKYFLLIAKT